MFLGTSLVDIINHKVLDVRSLCLCSSMSLQILLKVSRP